MMMGSVDIFLSFNLVRSGKEQGDFKVAYAFSSYGHSNTQIADFKARYILKSRVISFCK